MPRINDQRDGIEAHTWSAIQSNLSLKETIAYVKRRMKNVDERYIRKIYEEYAQ
jgi:hypothetical protein